MGRSYASPRKLLPPDSAIAIPAAGPGAITSGFPRVVGADVMRNLQ